jgi:hypothetical protein
VPQGGVIDDTVARVTSAATHTATETVNRDESAPAPHAQRRRVRRFLDILDRPASVDFAISFAYLSFGIFLTGGLWPDPAVRALAANVNDQALIEWFLAHGTLFWSGDFSLVTDRLNAPEGVNLMGNASHILHGILMAPVTAAFGVGMSFTLILAINLGATAAGWYLLLARTLKVNRFAAVVGGAVAGFGPGMISQSNSHLHITAQWLVPPMVWCVIRLTRVTTTRSMVRTGVGLALLVTAQAMLGEEVLFLAALTLTIFAITYALCRRAWARQVARRFLGGMALATAIATVLLAYPLWVQFAGRQAVISAPFSPDYFYADMKSYLLFSPLSLGGAPGNGRLATDATEFNTFLGWPLLLVVAVCVVWQWRSALTVATVVSAGVMALLSFGPRLVFDGERVGLPGLYALIKGMPVISGALPTRYALALLPLIGVFLAFALNRAMTRPADPAHLNAGQTARGRRLHGVTRIALPAAVVVALVPIAPKPLAATDRAAVPKFITSGNWRTCVPDGGTLVPVPLPTPTAPDSMRWAAAANARFALPEGFFIGPYGPKGRAVIGIYPRPTSLLLAKANQTGVIQAVNAPARAAARADLAYWRADCVVLAHVPNEEVLRYNLELLLGPGRQVDGTWIWDVRNLR